MAKKNWLCPFSGNLCRVCSLYRARHYYLCSRDYRGYQCKPGENSDTIASPAPGLSRNNKSETHHVKQEML